MQSAFSKWICTAEGTRWIMAEGEGVVAGTFELKHVACAGLKTARRKCDGSGCASRLRIGEHERSQCDGLAVASGVAFLPSRLAWCHKLPDIGSGYRPVDCVVLGRGALARFVIGWSCGRTFRAYAVPWEAVAGWIDNGGGSVTEDMAQAEGVALPWEGG